MRGMQFGERASPRPAALARRLRRGNGGAGPAAIANTCSGATIVSARQFSETFSKMRFSFVIDKRRRRQAGEFRARCRAASALLIEDTKEEHIATANARDFARREAGRRPGSLRRSGRCSSIAEDRRTLLAKSR